MTDFKFLKRYSGEMRIFTLVCTAAYVVSQSICILAYQTHTYKGQGTTPSRLEVIDKHLRTSSFEKACLCVCLRGGSNVDDVDERYQRFLKNIDSLNSAVDRLGNNEAAVDPDIMGMSVRGFPMGFNPNPDLCEVYKEPDTVDPVHKERQPIDPVKLQEVLKAAEWIEGLVNDMSPEGIDKLLKERGFKLEDLHPHKNSRGTFVGNFTLHEELRADMLKQIEDIRTTYAMLQYEMSQPSPVQTLKTEIDEIREKDLINPYVRLLHDWKKNKEDEHRSGAFLRQFRAVKKPAFAVEPPPAEPAPPGLEAVETPASAVAAQTGVQD